MFWRFMLNESSPKIVAKHSVNSSVPPLPIDVSQEMSSLIAFVGNSLATETYFHDCSKGLSFPTYLNETGKRSSYSRNAQSSVNGRRHI